MVVGKNKKRKDCRLYTKLRQDNVFTPVCHSVHRGDLSVPVCTTGHMTRGSLYGRRSLWRVSVGGLCSGGPLSRVISVREVSRGVSVQEGVSVQKGVSVLYGNERAVHILLECILVFK